MVDAITALCPALALHIIYLYVCLCYVLGCTASVLYFFLAKPLSFFLYY